MMDTRDWNTLAVNLLKTELALRGMKTDRLAQVAGVDLSHLEDSLQQGTLSAGMLLQCLSAMGCHDLRF